MESYLLHDANASSNFKIMMMTQKEGMKGYGIYWMILEFLRVQNGYKADVRILPVLARKMRVTVATLKRIIFDSGLFEVNGTTFSSPGLTRRMEPLEAKREANRESGRRGGLANQQRIREGMASDALPINKTNKRNNSPSISPQGETGKNGRLFLFRRSMHSTKIRTTMKADGRAATPKSDGRQGNQCHPKTHGFRKTERKDMENTL
nr:DUF4373 domain-containing protein [Bacteroides stercorirosoris]